MTEFSADRLVGCVEIGGRLDCETDRMAFVPGSPGERIAIPFGEIVEMRLGGRLGSDANRIDLTLLDGERLTFLVIGRDRIVEAIQVHQGWIDPESGARGAESVV